MDTADTNISIPATDSSSTATSGVRRISLRDLARQAGLSHATVSLALRDHPAVAAATKAHIRELAERLGYQPDPMLRALAEYRRDKTAPRYHATLAWLNFFGGERSRREPFGYRAGAEARAAELGYKLDVFPSTRSRESLRQLARVLQARNIQGLLLAPLPEPGEVLFDFAPFSAVTFGFSLTSPRLHTVTNYQAFSSMLALRALRARGFRRIGFLISHDLDERSRRSFLTGFLSEQMTLPEAERIPPQVHPSKGLRREDFDGLRPWFRRHRPDALISHYAELPALLGGNGIRVPQDIALARLSVGNDPSEVYNRSAGVNQNEYEIGRTAVDTLASILYHNERGVPAVPRTILIDGFWQEGETVIPREAMPARLRPVPARSPSATGKRLTGDR
ncbi:MAG: LacI family transcriptional regulator [Opitutaceae bacterium]|jgi:DNA-binding LacI/PurR family transcriptional regulator|nr:LacI family transcriptional regulator [Opitutaceae bacterium]